MMLLKLSRLKKNIENENVFCIKRKHYGVKNCDKTIYFIVEENKNLGFFAMYRYWLEYLYFADICGYTPVISAGSEFIYKENKKVNGTSNSFEYYFVQPASINVLEAKMSRQVIEANKIHRNMVELVFTGAYDNYSANKKYMYEMSRVVKKYLHFNQSTWEYIYNGIRQLNIQNEKVLGVHIRGTDFRAKYNNHPVYVTEEECFKEIDHLIDKELYKKIFVATDDNRILKNFIGKYGEQICFYKDVNRGSKNQSVAFSNSNRKNHKYLLGLEVIRDMYTLSMCSGLVAGVSQVALCAQINKMARNERYDDVKIINKGLNKNSHVFWGH